MQSRRFLSFRSQQQKRYRSSVLTKSELNDADKKDQVGSRNDGCFESIPQKRGLPLIGNLIELIMSNGAAQLHKYIDNRHKQLGPIFQEKLGSENCIFVSSASYMRSVFLYEGQHPKHPIPEAWSLYNAKHNCQRGLFFMNGTEWLNNRRLMNKLLLNGNCSWMNDSIEKYTRKCVTKWSEEIDVSEHGFIEICNLEGQLYRWSINVLCSIMFGQSFDQIDTNPKLEMKICEFTANVHKIFTSTTSLMSFPPKLAESLNLKRWTDFEENVSLVLKLGNDIVDEFLKDPCDDGLVSKMKEVDMPLDMIKRIFVDLIVAAGDTTAFSSQWLIYLLAKNQDIQTKLRDEILTSNNWMENPYTKGLIRETLRLYPVAPFIGRYLASDAVIGNYKINKDSLVLLSLYTSGRDEEHFPDPDAVLPERWIRNSETGELDMVHKAHGTLPFALGGRSCIGRKIALNQMQALVALMTTNFNVKYCAPYDVHITLRLVAVPDKPIVLRLEKI